MLVVRRMRTIIFYCKHNDRAADCEPSVLVVLTITANLQIFSLDRQ